MINYDDVPHEIHQTVKITAFRRHLAHYVAMVRYGGDHIRIQRRGADSVYLVSKADFQLIQKKAFDLMYTPMVDDKGHMSNFWTMLQHALKRDRKTD